MIYPMKIALFRVLIRIAANKNARQEQSHLIHLETHPVVDLIVTKCYVILEGGVPGHAI
jgi:hypothetical protein